MTDQQDGAHGPPTPTFPMPDGLGEFSGFDAFAPPQQQELRGPRRSDVVTYTLRATLVDVDPPIWRQLDVASDLGLPQMHTVLQAAFGWADSHLHLFEKGERPGDHQQYLMDSSLDEGMTGTAESQVRLDEVLSVVGDTLTYEYDFGDSWVHTVVLEAITDRTPDAADAVCIDGARSGPPEDCGGAPGYEDLLQVLADPAHPRYPDLQEWLGREFTPETFDPAVVNLALQTVHQQALARQTLPAALTEIVDRVGGSPATQIWQLVFAADLGAEVEIDLATATEMTADYRWWLGRIGDGIKLSSAGHLPPAHVKAIAERLNLAAEWHGTFSRESNARPVLVFRESISRLGLSRTVKGVVQTTALGRKLVDRPLDLCRHIAGKLPIVTHPSEQIAGSLLLLQLAAGADTDVPFGDHSPDLLAEAMLELGWRAADTGTLDRQDTRAMTRATRDVLIRVGAMPRDYYRPGALGEDERDLMRRRGILLARQALGHRA